MKHELKCEPFKEKPLTITNRQKKIAQWSIKCSVCDCYIFFFFLSLLLFHFILHSFTISVRLFIHFNVSACDAICCRKKKLEICVECNKKLKPFGFFPWFFVIWIAFVVFLIWFSFSLANAFTLPPSKKNAICIRICICIH